VRPLAFKPRGQKTGFQMTHYRFASHAAAITALQQEPAPITLTRFARTPEAHVIVAINDAAAAIPYIPVPGEHPDRRRDRLVTADIELEYLYQQLIERGHAQQVLSIDHGHLVELTVIRVEIAGDPEIYGFVLPKPVSQ
jgi:hypothetical protein